ncbi:MAG: hypothetical protein ABSG00_00125 [Terracidiphilus sp.]
MKVSEAPVVALMGFDPNGVDDVMLTTEVAVGAGLTVTGRL